MFEYIRKYKGEILSFICTIFIYVIIFLLLGIFKNSILKSDLLVQMVPLFNYLTEFFKGNVGLYSFNFGLGDSIIGTVYYYLLSPFNLLLLFIKNINLLVICIVILKAAFSSLFCYKYLKYHFKEANYLYLTIFSLFYGISSYIVSYNMFIQFLDVYMMFPLLLLGIDKIVKEKKYTLYVISLMLIILFNYYFAFMVCIFAFLYYNYRILLDKMNAREYFKNNFKFIFMSFLACLSMSFILLPVGAEIGSYSRDFSGLFGGEPLEILLNFNDFVMHYIFGEFISIEIINRSNFYLYTSIIVIPLIILFFFNKNINKREKKLTLIMFLILLVSISFNYINYIWHGFMPPCAVNGRFTFMFILFIIYISLKSLLNYKKENFKSLFIIYILINLVLFLYLVISFPRFFDITLFLSVTFLYFSLITVALYIKKKNYKFKIYIILFIIDLIISGLLLFLNIINLSYFMRLLLLPVALFLFNIFIKRRNLTFLKFTIIFLIILIPFYIYMIFSNIIIIGLYVVVKIILLLLILLLFKYFNKIKVANIMLVLLLIFEMFYNTYNNLYRFEYNFKNDFSYKNNIDYIKTIDDSLFYRIEDNSKKHNNSFLYNYYGVDYFMSSMKTSYIDFFYRIGLYNFSSGKNNVFYDGSYHLLSSLINIKYFIDCNENGKDEYKFSQYDELKSYNNIYEKINSIDIYDIYRNNDALELGYMVDTKIKDVKFLEDGLGYINEIYKNMSGNSKDILNRVEIKKIDDYNFSFNNYSDKDFFVLFDLCENNSSDFTPLLVINNEKPKSYANSYLYKIDNKYDLNEEINLKLFNVDLLKEDSLNIYVYYYNDDVYKEQIDILNDQQLKVTKVNKDGIEGTINVLEDKVLFLSCLYNEDLEIYVDGKQYDKFELLDTFIGIDLEQGIHEIKIRYKPKILLISFIPSLIGVGILIILFLKKKDLI